MSLERRIEALEREVRSIRGTSKDRELEYESSLEFQSNNFIPKMASSVEKHLEALTALVGPSFKVEGGELFIKNPFIEETSIQGAKYDLRLGISRTKDNKMEITEKEISAVKKTLISLEETLRIQLQVMNANFLELSRIVQFNSQLFSEKSQ